MTSAIRDLFGHKDKRWLCIWLGGIITLWSWNLAFLNPPALVLLRAASLNTLFVGVVVVLLATVFGWLSGVALHMFEDLRHRLPLVTLTFILNLVRSIPQIIGVLVGYVILTMLIQDEILRTPLIQLLWIALVISLFVFLEISDLIRERIAYYKKLDFYDAMLCSGIRERSIINNEILWKNSRAHLLHKLIAIFGMTIFLLSSVDFIISVGLSSDVSLGNFPVTLGGLLARLDSKQDILAIGATLTDPLSVTSLFFEHLQGVSTAFTIVFSLVCLHKISNGLVQRLRL